MNDLNLNSPDQWDLIGRYLSGELAGEQKRLLERWVQASPENREQFEAALQAWQLAGAAEDTYIPDVDAGWARFSQHLQQEQHPAQEAKVIRMQPAVAEKKPTYWWQAAAAVLVLGLLALVLKLYTVQQAQPAELIRVVALHDKQELYLPDSSHIFLNRNSEVTYPADFTADNRIVNLKGEAFFDVRKAAGKPFTVFGPRSKTQVLGTSFNVKALAGEGNESVTVFSGKVSFSDKEDENQQVILLPGNTGILNAQRVVIKETAKDSNALAWKTDRLVFNNTSLHDVTNALEKYFGVRITAENAAVLNCRFTGTFEKPELPQVMEVLALTNNLTIKQEGRVYILSGGGCK